jgi:hypothetical protein
MHVDCEVKLPCKVILSGVHDPVFNTYILENRVKEFYPHKTLSILIELLSSFFINTVPHQRILCL